MNNIELMTHMMVKDIRQVNDITELQGCIRALLEEMKAHHEAPEEHARREMAMWRAEKAVQEAPRQVAKGMVLMPDSLTAENGAKYALIGNFTEIVQVDCPLCEGGDFTDKAGGCDECGGTAVTDQEVPVRWTTIKAIYAAAVAHFTEGQCDG